MKHLMLLVVMCAGCAGTQTREALTVRAPAPSYAPLRPNQSAAHEANLRRALDRAIEEQEILDDANRE